MIGIICSDEKFLNDLSDAIKKEGFEVKGYMDKNFIEDLDFLHFLIIDLDFSLDWIEIFKKYNLKDAIIVASKKTKETLKEFLDLGISDFLIKPVFIEEIVFKIKRFCMQSFKIGSVEINFSRNFVKTPKSVIPLTKKERDLLYLLVKFKNRIVTYDQIRDYVYAYDYPSDNAIHLLISRLKKKLELNIESVAREGYILKV